MRFKDKLNNLINPPDFPPLWDRRFIIFTAGTAVSILGNSIADFLIGLLVLDLSKSTLLYSLYLATFSATNFIGPFFAGVFLDRFSRVKIIYLLDFLSAGLYALLAVLLFFHELPYFVLFAICALIGFINSIYTVAYQSLFPLLIDSRNSVRAESIISTISTMGLVMIPVATFLYSLVDMWLLFFVCSVFFGFAACFETKIHVAESQAAGDDNLSLKGYFRSVREGISYLKSERGLLLMIICVTLVGVVLSVDNTLMLPFFRSHYKNGEYLYFVVMFFYTAGTFWASILGYLKSIRNQMRFFLMSIALITTPLLSGIYLSLSIVLMCILNCIHGFFDELRISIVAATENNYISNNFRGRYYGFSKMISSAGSLIGEFTAGILSQHYSEPSILLGMGVVIAVVILLILCFGKTDIKHVFLPE